MQKHINKIMTLFPDAFHLVSPDWEPENLTGAFFDVFCWLRDNVSTLDKKIIHQKLKELDAYCLAAPRGNTKYTNDLYTKYIVGFIEDLVSSELRQFLPIIMDKKSFIANKEYYLQWVGKDNYEKTLVFYNNPSLR